MPLVKLCGRAELPPQGQVRAMQAGEAMVCVANVGGNISVMPNECPHRGAPLGEGTVEDGLVMCPYHAWTFDPATGAINGDPSERIPLYPVRIEGEEVLLEM